MRNNTITMNNSGGEREKNRKCTWQEEGTHHPSLSSLRSSNYKGRASFLPIRRRKCRRSEWKSRCFNVYVSPFFSLVLIASLAPPPFPRRLEADNFTRVTPQFVVCHRSCSSTTHGRDSFLSPFFSFDRYCRSFSFFFLFQ